jgi:divalent metal cation (Fe/Co/Zn/Cd) transporter
VTEHFGVPWVDGASSILIGVLLCAIALVMVYESKGLLIGEGVEKRTSEGLRTLIGADPAVEWIGRLGTMYLGPDEVMLAIEVRFRRENTRAETRHAIARLTRAIQDKHPRIRHVYLDASSLGE